VLDCDAFWQPGRFADSASDDQVIGALGLLLCAAGKAVTL
jgi:hypothetical protein